MRKKFDVSLENRKIGESTEERRGVLVPAVRAAREVGLPYTSLRDVAHRGEIPVVFVGRAWYFRRADLMRWVTNCAQVLR
jgi:excisionase family DNA binding protein